jgi:hypothetical protein
MPASTKEEAEEEENATGRNAVHFARRLYRISTCRQGNELEEGVDSLKNLQSRWKVFILTDSAPNREAKLIRCYFLSYIILGTALFSNFLPWT